MDLLREAAARAPDAPAIDDGRRVWTFAELDAASGRMARRLAPRGVAPGGVVALLCEPCVLGVQAIFAVTRLGATVAPLNPGLRRPELEAAIDALGPGLILSTGSAEASGALDPAWALRLEELPPPPLGHEELGDGLAPPDPFAVLWTSGTGGQARAVALSERAFRLVGSASALLLGSGPDARWYAALSFGHVGGLALVLRAVQHGATLVTRGRFEVDELAGLVDEGGVTHASLVPTMLARLLDARRARPAPASLACLLVGGAHTPAPLLERALDLGYPVALTYGMTETTSQVATAPPALAREKPGTVGRPLEGVDVTVADDGEVLVRGPTLGRVHAQGAAPLAGADGWYATGDLGRMDHDGHLWISGRKSERIISGGVNVDPQEVEESLRRLAGVADALVVGLDDPEWGERVAALVVPLAGTEPDPDGWIADLHQRLSAAKIPRMTRVIDALPRLPGGKPDRAAARELLSDAPP